MTDGPLVVTPVRLAHPLAHEELSEAHISHCLAVDQDATSLWLASTLRTTTLDGHLYLPLIL